MEREKESPPRPADEEERRGAHNEIGFRNVDEDAEHDERGSQGEGAGESPPREN